MKLNLVKASWGNLAGLILITVMAAGCYRPDSDPALTDNPTAPAIAGSTSTNPSSADTGRLRVGDGVQVTLSGLPPDQLPAPHEEVIKDDGTVTLPDIGKIIAIGKTDGELQNIIHDLYVPRIYTHLTVTVNVMQRVYYVRGEVKSPNRFEYVGEVTVTKAIGAAGDFTDFANRRNVILIRANGQHIKVNCNRILSGDAPDLPVYPGDQIVVKKSIW